MNLSIEMLLSLKFQPYFFYGKSEAIIFGLLQNYKHFMVKPTDSRDK